MELPGLEWLNLIARWIHLIVGIAWIGSSFYFVWQDNSLLPTKDDPERKTLQGDIWMVHGGGFYHARKFKIAPPDLPSHLHWFKWEAYSTWLSGFALLVLVYYLGGATYMMPAGGDLSQGAAVAIGLGALAGSWLVYDLLCRSPLGRDDRWLAVAVVVLVAVLSYAMTHLLSGRAAFLHVGAALGTIMVANVFFVIIPNQRRSVNAMRAGETPDPVWGMKGKQRSVHNTYFTLPVLFLMISNHYPIAYDHPHSWLVLLALAAVGAAVRHVFVLRHTHRAKAWMLPAVGAAMVAVILAVTATRTLNAPATASTTAEPLTAEAAGSLTPVVTAIVQSRCTACHAAQPTWEGFDAAPMGVVLETPEHIRHWAAKIHEQAVASEAMPLGNVTEITPEERALLGRWIAAQE